MVTIEDDTILLKQLEKLREQYERIIETRVDELYLPEHKKTINNGEFVKLERQLCFKCEKIKKMLWLIDRDKYPITIKHNLQYYNPEVIYCKECGNMVEHHASNTASNFKDSIEKCSEHKNRRIIIKKEEVYYDIGRRAHIQQRGSTETVPESN